MTRRGVLLACAGGALIAAALASPAWLARVPQERLGLLAQGDRVELLPPGVHLRLPGGRFRVIPSGAAAYEDAALVRTPEGASLRVRWRLTLDLGNAHESALRQVADAAGPQDDGAVRTAVARQVALILQEQGLAGTPLAQEALAAGMASWGLVAGSVRVESPFTAGPEDSRPAAAAHPAAQGWTGARWPLLVIGIDAADWDLIDPMIRSRDLPHLARLKERAAWAPLRSMKPTLSPILWTTIATGRPPEEHGVLDFLVRDASGAEVPISRLSRRVKALWNIATDLDVPSATVGWWATWPAEPVLGAMVSDRLAYSLFDLAAGESDRGTVFPPGLTEELDRLRVEEEDVTHEDVRPIVPIDAGRFEAAREALGTPAAFRDPVAHLIKVIASTRTYHQVARHLLATRRPKLTLVYFEGLDEVNHRFAHYMPPAMGLVSGDPPAARDAFAGAVPAFYRLQDRLVGELVEAAGPEAIVVILSDHGFANGEERPDDVPPDIDERPGLWHTMEGVLLIAGPPVRPGRIERPVALLDVTPTLLALMGLPKAADMPGRVVEEIFAASADPLDKAPEVASYDAAGRPLPGPDAIAGSPAVDEEMIARLQALGYVQSGGARAPDPGAADAGDMTATYHVNAGHIFLQKNDLDRAAAEFEKARALAPRFDPPRLGLAQVEVARGRPAAALPWIEETLREGKPTAGFFTRAARVYIMAGRQREGLAVMRSLPPSGRGEGARLAAVGMLQESAGDGPEALASYRHALEADPSQPRALQGAYRLMRPSGKLEDLASLLEKGMEAGRRSMRVRTANWLALTREAQGRGDDARRLLADVLAEAPTDLMTLTNLGSMLVRVDRAAEALPYLERARSISPRSHEVLVNLIVAHGKAGRLDDARAIFLEAEDAARADDPAVQRHNALAFAAFLNGDLDLAADQIARSLQIDPAQEDARKLRDMIARRR